MIIISSLILKVGCVKNAMNYLCVPCSYTDSC